MFYPHSLFSSSLPLSSSLSDQMPGLLRLLDEVGQWFDAHEAGPQVNIFTNEQGAVVQLAVPGYRPQDLSIEVEGDMLTVQGKAPSQEEQEGAPLRQEISRAAFRRQIQLPFKIDNEQSQASHENGILSIALAKPRQEQARQIAISASK